ncbi:unnamed protein product (mitochondrion) [Plasmodiophora brassicae]|uniref:Centrosomin N-terminal motif 1 domain-containing protein n=1 Tax=Plasmodiophora brassicae TaxID=37360 RepID=A0A3P3Y6E5_PLABS|nr:unnamed protein product [Plasmodiophora brassicae]
MHCRMEAIPVRTVYRGPLALGRGGPMVRNGRTSTGWASEDHDDDAARRQSEATARRIDLVEQENFNLKLKIAYLNDRVSERFPVSVQDLVRENAELAMAIKEKDRLLGKVRNSITTLQADNELLRAKQTIHNEDEAGLHLEEVRLVQEASRQNESEIQRLRVELSESRRGAERAMQDAESARIALKDAEQSVQDVKGALTRTQTELVQTTASLAEVTAARDRLRNELQEARNSLAVTRAELAKASADAMDVDKLKAEVSHLQRELARKDDHHERARAELERVRAELDRERAEIDQTQRRMQSEIQASRESVASRSRELAKAAEEIRRFEVELREAAQRESTLLKERDRYKASFDEASKMQAALEEAVRKQAAFEEAARKQAAFEEVTRKQAAFEEAARKQAAFEEAARKQAAFEEAARKQAVTPSPGHTPVIDAVDSDGDRIREIQKVLRKRDAAITSLSASMERIISALDNLRIPSFWIGPTDDEPRLVYSDDTRPPVFDGSDLTHLDIVEAWVHRKVFRLKKIRSSLKFALEQVEKRWTEQLDALRHCVEQEHKRVDALQKHELRSTSQQLFH